MFERRLKVILALLFVVTLVLMVRAGQLQIVQRQHWTQQADEALRRDESLETMRGSLLDVNGVPLAMDVACIDACVDYRAIIDPPDPLWVGKLATQWAHTRRIDELRAADVAGKKAIEAQAKQDVLAHIASMWTTLATVGNKSPEEMLAIRQAIVRRVELRRRYVWYRKYEQAREAHDEQQHAKGPSPWWKRWLIDDTQDAPQLENFDVNVAEQEAAHPVLPAISTEVQNFLGKEVEDFPGLILRPGMTRNYPRGEAVCHVTGRLSRVEQEDLKRDPFAADDSRKYEFNDLIGRSGLEAMCEPLLRGSRGHISRELGGSASSNEADDRIVERSDAAKGDDVRCSIDVELQDEILSTFKKADIDFNDGPPGQKELDTHRTVSVHGGAVLIDVATGEVRALVSNPGFDPNMLDQNYATLALDDINKPLLNRATQYPLETGSTIKPVVGIGAITQGVLGVTEGIECTGYLKIGNKTYKVGRCWTASKFANNPEAAGHIAHHEIPYEAPHRGRDGNPDGFLIFADALERSCNVFFETTASRLGLDGLSYWMNKFGLGRPTGLGIEEWSGLLPDSYTGPEVQHTTWSAGIGQGQIAATPVQMANVAATIARDGIWMRPTLVSSAVANQLRTIERGANPSAVESKTYHWWMLPDRVDLQLSPVAIKAAHEGMWAVVNHKFSGTGYVGLHSTTINIAGKTGTAEAAPLKRLLRDAAGKPLRDEKGRTMHEDVQPSTWEKENPQAPWYLAYDKDGTNIKHSWIIGYAPADHPKVAFAVMVEYGGSGGTSAAAIARAMLESAAQRGYLPRMSPGSNGPVAVAEGQ